MTTRQVETWGLGQAARLIGAPYPTLNDWVASIDGCDGLMVRRGRDGRFRCLTFLGIVAFHVGAALRAKGVGFGGVQTFLTWLAEQTEAGLDSHFAAGRTHVAIGDGQVVGPVVPDFALKNVGSNAVISVAVVNLGAVFIKLRRRLCEAKASAQE